MPVDVIALAVGASVCTALASVAQRHAAEPAPRELSFSWRLVPFLLRRPTWFLGFASLTGGFIFQVWALDLGSLSLVQPLIASELVIVFGVLAIQSRRSVRTRDWFAAVGMVVGLGAFLALARPSEGHGHPSSIVWVLAGGSASALAAVLAGIAIVGDRGHRGPSNRKAALLGAAAATEFGFVAAVTKEFSAHLSQGISGEIANWSPYVLIVTGIAAMFLASNAFQAGSLAASQPGLTIGDPLVASLLGVLLFGDRLDFSPLNLAGEVLALGVLAGSVVLLSQSPLVRGEPPPPSGDPPVTAPTPGAN